MEDPIPQGLHYGYRTCKWPSLLPRFDSMMAAMVCFKYIQNVFKDAFQPYSRLILSSFGCFKYVQYVFKRRFSTLFTFDSLIVRLLQVRPIRI